MICTIFGDLPDERALRLEAISIAGESKVPLDEQSLLSVVCDIEQLLMGKTLAVEANIKEKIKRILKGSRLSS
jgi:hypothetical protein